MDKNKLVFEKYLNELEKRLEQDDSSFVKELYFNDIQEIIMYFDQEDLLLDDLIIPAFINHIVVFFLRLHEGNQMMEPLPADITDHVSLESLATSNEVLIRVEEKHKKEISEFEKFLFSLYVEMAKTSERSE